MRRNAVGLRKGSKSAVRDKRYGGGKRSSRGMQQIQQQYMQPSAPMIYNGVSASKSVGGRRKKSSIKDAECKYPVRVFSDCLLIL